MSSGRHLGLDVDGAPMRVYVDGPVGGIGFFGEDDTNPSPADVDRRLMAFFDRHLADSRNG